MGPEIAASDRSRDRFRNKIVDTRPSCYALGSRKVSDITHRKIDTVSVTMFLELLQCLVEWPPLIEAGHNKTQSRDIRRTKRCNAIDQYARTMYRT